MSSKIAAVADAVTAALNAGAFGVSFIAQRLWVPYFDPGDESGEGGDLDALRVSVVAVDRDNTLLTRSAWQDDLVIQIGIQQRVGDETPAVVDPLLAVAEAIFDSFAPGGVYGNAKLFRKRHGPIFDPGMLREMRVFTSVITLTLKLF